MLISRIQTNINNLVRETFIEIQVKLNVMFSFRVASISALKFLNVEKKSISENN